MPEASGMRISMVFPHVRKPGQTVRLSVESSTVQHAKLNEFPTTLIILYNADFQPTAMR